jgi:hypothetical protein
MDEIAKNDKGLAAGKIDRIHHNKIADVTQSTKILIRWNYRNHLRGG